MKIIGKNNDDGYFISATKREIANLIGYYNIYCCEEKKIRIDVGMEIHISEMYSQLHSLASAKSDLLACRTNLLTAAKLCDMVSPVLAAALTGAAEDGMVKEVGDAVVG